MSKAQWRGATLLAPVPAVMVSCGTMEESNILTIAWTGIINSNPPKTYISIRPERYSYKVIKETGEFVINLTTSSLVRATDFCGVRSGRDFDKFEKMALTKESAAHLNCPMIEESPVNLECRVTEIIPLGSHDMFLADILAVNVDEQYLDERGKLHLDKAQLISYAHGEYFELGKKLGSFGYTVRKKKKKIRKKNVKK
ncbi:flavin reductase family protein [Eubacterium limosum]|uniref:Flavin reductase family protein n=1 Tax=Eubacterium limosum TaxID=1736 RepID=A0ABT5UP22_EUBLI|nr:flavin reductase family protein [Eubacterium limosum]MCB6568044.1 flavin reductase family protein [Eubacterium limosum]MDE1470169.1 flavin reductase family protein [Eubacterium limosum]